MGFTGLSAVEGQPMQAGFKLSESFQLRNPSSPLAVFGSSRMHTATN